MNTFSSEPVVQVMFSWLFQWSWSAIVCDNIPCVIQVKALPGLGTTVDVILVNGILHEGDTIILAGTEGPIVTQIRGLLMPKPMKEIRVKVSGLFIVQGVKNDYVSSTDLFCELVFKNACCTEVQLLYLYLISL